MSIITELSDFMASYYGLCAGILNQPYRHYGPDMRGKDTRDFQFKRTVPSYVFTEPVCPVPEEKLVSGMKQVRAFEKIFLMRSQDVERHLLWHGKDDPILSGLFKASNQWNMHQFRYNRPVMTYGESEKVRQIIDKQAKGFNTHGFNHELEYLEEAKNDWDYIPADWNGEYSFTQQATNFPSKAKGDALKFNANDRGEFVKLYEDGSLCFCSMRTQRGGLEYLGRTHIFWDAEDNSLYLNIYVRSLTAKQVHEGEWGQSDSIRAPWSNRLLKAAPWLSRPAGHHGYLEAVEWAFKCLKAGNNNIANSFLNSLYYVRFLRGEISTDEFAEYGGGLNSRLRNQNIEDMASYLQLTHKILHEARSADTDVYRVSQSDRGHSASDYVIGSGSLGFAACSRVSVQIGVGCGELTEVGVTYEHSF